MLRNYAIAGAGVRGLCYARAMLGEFSTSAKLVGLFDHNRTRQDAFNRLIGSSIAAYTDFDQMVREQRPQVLIICTPDHTHDDLIAQAFEHGLDVVCEKPMATTAAKVQRILRLEREFRRSVRVVFNLRYGAYPRALKRVIMESNIGPIHNVQMEWFLDKIHGPEYFRRWHRHMRQSGGLLVHKATHHFDLVNWMIEQRPRRVCALGGLRFYGRSGPFRGERCGTCPHGSQCEFHIDIAHDPAQQMLDQLYRQAEHEDNYIRDSCVFGEDIDIYDTMSVAVQYAGGAQLAYSLTAYAPCEGYRMTLTGARGRIEAQEYHGGLLSSPDRPDNHIVVYRNVPRRREVAIERIAVPADTSEHGGGDRGLYRAIFEGVEDETLAQAAGSVDGAASCLIGICANESIRLQKTVDLPNIEEAEDPGAVHNGECSEVACMR